MFSKKTYLAKGEPKLNDQVTSTIMPAFQKNPLNIWHHFIYGTFDSNKKSVNIGILTHQNPFDKRLIKTYDTKKPKPGENLFTSHITINHERTNIELSKYNELEKKFEVKDNEFTTQQTAKKMKTYLSSDYFDDPIKYHGCIINHNHFDDWLSKQPDDVVFRIISLHGKILNQKYENGSRPVFENAILEMHNTGRLPITISLKEYDANLAKMAATLRTYLNRPDVDAELVAGYKTQLKEIEELRTLLRTRRYI